MKIKFDNPCPDADSFDTDIIDSRVKFKSNSGVKVISPYKGEVSYVSNDSISIKHEVSNFGTQIVCDSTFTFINAIVVKGQKVNQGDVIGTTRNKDLIYELVFLPPGDEMPPSIDAKKIISGGLSLSSGDENILKRSKKTKERSGGSPSTSDSIYDDLFKVLLSPVQFAKSALDLDDDDVLKEHLVKHDIKNIKRLL